MSRYYDSNTGRFISPDAMMSGVSTSLDGFNLYAYCFNNPVMMTDGEGNWPKWLKVIATVRAAVITALVAPVMAPINHVVNEIYYNYISDGKSDLDSDTYSKEGRYISRWERLDYTKQETKSKKYDKTAKMYFAEYNVHMYAWMVLGPFYTGEDATEGLSFYAKRARKADVVAGKYDSDPWVKFATQIFMYLGM